MKKTLSMALVLGILFCLLPGAAAAEAVPVTLQFESQISAEDLKISSLTALEQADAFLFTLTYESAVTRTLSVFNPPSGSVFMGTYALPAAQGAQAFTFTLYRDTLASVNNITLKFFADQAEAMTGNYVFLDDPAAALGIEKSDAAQFEGMAKIGKAITYNGTTYLPIRAYFEAAGAAVTWVPETKSITVTASGQEVAAFTVGSTAVTSGGNSADLASPVLNVDDTAYFDPTGIGGGNYKIDEKTLDVYMHNAQVSTYEAVTPTPESYVNRLTQSGSGLVRHVPANQMDLTDPLTLEAKSTYTRWIWEDVGEADVRWLDATALSGGDLALLKKAAPNITFNTDTVFPASMQETYDPKAILEAGKDPGLGVKALHQSGITGKGVGIAIIDQPLYTDHPEYKDKLALYEEIHITENAVCTMHGAAVASIAVGDSCGVAPGAKLYYIGLDLSRSVNGGSNADVNIAFGEGLAVAVDRIVEVNKSLPQDEKIRVISISRGFSNLEDEGVKTFLAAVERAKAEGIFVLTTSTHEYYDWLSEENDYGGLGKLDFAGDPNDLSNYTLGTWEQQNAKSYVNKLLIPMDARTTADFTQGDGYVFYADGGYSWVAPYLAGVYALACQVDPAITPERFWTLALQTGDSITATIRSYEDVATGADGTAYTFSHVIDPAGLIAALK